MSRFQIIFLYFLDETNSFVPALAPRRSLRFQGAFTRSETSSRCEQVYVVYATTRLRRQWGEERTMKRYLIFAAIGPFMAGFLLLLATTVSSGYWDETNWGEVGKFFTTFVKTLPFSYLFGIVPGLMIGAVDDILLHIRRIRPVLRMLIVGVIAFVAAEFMYGSRGSDSGAVQFILYGLVGFVPATISSWLAHKYADEPQPVTSPSP
jgi:uncharacterized membrane protein YeaQ/YmgE (transglycosylase-associated protein family)